MQSDPLVPSPLLVVWLYWLRCWFMGQHGDESRLA